MVFVPERRPDHDSDTGNGAGYRTGDGADRDIAEGTGSAYGPLAAAGAASSARMPTLLVVSTAPSTALRATVATSPSTSPVP